MTQKEVLVVKKSWQLLRGIDPLLIGDVFYGRLFLQEPALRSMFPPEMKGQYQKLVDMLSYIVSKLDRMDQLTEDIRQLAIRHAGYGVKPAHYKLVGDALLWTLGRGLGKDWSPEVESAWKKCYEMLSATMIVSAK
jgi:hemoglobin-like flavoprotein